MKLAAVSSILILGAFFSVGEGKVFGKCELVNALRSYGFPQHQIPTWVCMANYESHFNTDATNTVTGDHGIFQISQIYWCSSYGGPGGACNRRCADFHDDDIRDDAACVRKIYDEHQRLSGNGFNAWTVYRTYCAGDNSQWVAGC